MSDRKKLLSEQAIDNVRRWFDENGRGTAVIGISGGKDSAVVAGLCVRALGKDRVVGVLMPDGTQADIEDSRKVVSELGIRHLEANVGEACKAMRSCIGKAFQEWSGTGAFGPVQGVSPAAMINVPPRERMTALYTIAQTISELNGEHAAVIGTGNKAESMVGYCTKGGDDKSDMDPIGDYWVSEVLRIGDELGYYPDIIHKAPADGLCGRTDEDRLGFGYDQVEMAFTGREAELPPEILEKILRMHRLSEHKRRPVEVFRRA